MEIHELMKMRAEQVSRALEAFVSDGDPEFGVIFDAMRYSLLAGGKRLRPFLIFEFAELGAGISGGSREEALERAMPFACAIEMIHTYSLIHDDLPCMDNDDLRRGKPTSHRVFGEANALLAGDALLTKAFETASENSLAAPEENMKAVSLLARCAGASGMIGGQVLDLIGETRRFELETLERLQSLKTGELIRCSCLLGLIAGRAYDGETVSAAERYAESMGRAFQVTDDILDAVGDETELGKPIGSDAESGKTTFLTLMSVSEARDYAARLTSSAVNAIKRLPGSETLIALAVTLKDRRN